MSDISVVMPLYNPNLERIRESIKSCWDQECTVEVMVVNDGSVFDMLSTGERVRVLNRPHEGLVAAVNAGIQMANGEYIITLADDTFCRNALSALLRAARASADPVNTFAYGNIQLPDRLVINKPWTPHKPGDGLKTSAAVLWHRSHYPACQFWHAPEMEYYAEDYDFVLQLEASGLRGMHVDVTVMYHTPGAQSAGVQENKEAIRRVLRRRYEELNNGV